METLIKLLNNSKVTDYKIITNSKETSELYFVHKSLETTRHTKTKTTKVTVYVTHDEFLGQADFSVNVSDNEEDIKEKIELNYNKALLIKNKPYELYVGESKTYENESDLNNYSLNEIAKLVSEAAFKVNFAKDGSINALEIFVNKNIKTISTSKNIFKEETSYDVMIEAIPTWNGKRESVELYSQTHYGSLNLDQITNDLTEKMEEVEARYNAIKPNFKLDCDIVLRPHEIKNTLDEVVRDSNFTTIYQHQNLHQIGDNLQPSDCDKLNITMKGVLEGSIYSSHFDNDAVFLKDKFIIQNGVLKEKYGSLQYATYLKEEATGNLGCMEVGSGSLDKTDLKAPYLEAVSLSGIQLDPFNDYIGGEIRLGYYYDKEKMIPVTGIAFSGKLSDALNTLGLSKEVVLDGAYKGPKFARISKMKIV